MRRELRRSLAFACRSSLAVLLLLVGPAERTASQEPGRDFDHTATRFVLTGTHENVPCEGCHRMGVFRGTPTECSFCHDGSGMRAESGKPIDHIPTANRCQDCHTSVTWLEVRFDHIAVNGSCSSCHNGISATGQPNDHFRTVQQCDICHTQIRWRPGIFRHASPNYPGDHARGLDCTACHPGNSEMVVYSDDPSLAPDCAGCHRNDYKSGPHKKHENPETSYTVQELRDCTGSCHVYEDATLGQIKKTRNREHRVSDREF
jgi:hypothetical protein